MSAFQEAQDALAQRIVRTRAIRGMCYRFKDGNTIPANEAEARWKSQIEALPGFSRWGEFSLTWNIDRDKMKQDIDYLEITKLDMSLEEQWEVDVRRHARELPTKGHDRIRNLQLPPSAR